MSNLAKIYNDATGKGPLARERLEKQDSKFINEARPIETIQSDGTITESELTAQNKIDWLSHPRTQKMFNEIGEDIKYYEEQSELLACSSNAEPSNYKLVTAFLVKAKTLKNILLKFSQDKIKFVDRL